MTDKCRAEFERELKSREPHVRLERDGEGYKHPFTQFDWDMWQAAWNSAQGWQPIETAPRDGTWFMGLVEGAIYKMYAFMNVDKVNYHWVMHTNMASGQTLRIERYDDGNERRVQIKDADDPRYEPQILAYKFGMNLIPTHWMPLPEPPVVEE